MVTEYTSLQSTKGALSIPTIMPDEYWTGYLGRLLIFNGINHGIGHVAANQLLTKLVCEIATDINDLPILVKLARLLKIEVATVVNRHSLIPIIQNSKIKNYESKSSLKRIHTNSFRLIKNGSYFCERCSSDDQHRFGCSYWRKSHQLPGVDWCMQHGNSLHKVISINAMYSAPDVHISNNNFLRSKFGDTSKNNAYVKKYCDLITHYADCHYKIDRKAIVKQLYETAFALNVPINNRSRKLKISAFLIQELPSDWIAEHFSGLIQYKHIPSIPGYDDLHLENNIFKISNLILIVSVFFQNQDNFLYDFMQALDEKRIRVQTKIINKTTDTELVETYIKHMGNIYACSKELSISNKILKKKLLTLGCPGLRLNEPSVWALFRYYEGLPLEEALSGERINVEKVNYTIKAGSYCVHLAIRKQVLSKPVEIIGNY